MGLAARSQRGCLIHYCISLQIVLLQQGVPFGNIATPDYLRTGELPISRPPCSVVENNKQTWAGQDSRHVTSNDCARSPAMTNYGPPTAIDATSSLHHKKREHQPSDFSGLGGTDQRGCLIHYCFLYRFVKVLPILA